MAVTYGLMSIPFWYMSDAAGRPLAGGWMDSFSTANPSLRKPLYMTQGNEFPYSNPLYFDGSGTLPGPLYGSNDDTVTNDNYNLVFYDAAGNIVRSVDNFPMGGGGGSGPTTNYIDIENHVANAQFWNNYPVPTGPVPAGEYIPVAPPAWFFYKNNLATNDSISFSDLSLGDAYPVNSPSNNPRYVFTYSNGDVATGESRKDLIYQFPDVKTFSGEKITVSFEAKGSVAADANILILQFFGSGGGSGVHTQQFPFTFSTTEYAQVINYNITVDSVATQTEGTAGDSWIGIGIRFPLDTTGTFSVGNFQVQSGQIAQTDFEFETTIEQENRSVEFQNAFITGDVKFSYAKDATGLPGWLLLDDTEIGATNDATHFGAQYFRLYQFLWTNVSQPSANTYCIVSGGLGASALEDWNANKTLNLPKTMGRTFQNHGRPVPYDPIYSPDTYALAQPYGFQYSDSVPKHFHTINWTGFSPTPGGLNINMFSTAAGGGFSNRGIMYQLSDDTPELRQVKTDLTGDSTVSLLQPTATINAFIKL